MYLPSASPILPGDRVNAARKLACSSARRDDAAQTSIAGRIALWRTIQSPADLAQSFGVQTGANASMMQGDTLVSRATTLTGSIDSAPSTNAAEDPTPKCFSMNGQPGQVGGCSWTLPPQPKAPPSPVPTMPAQAPIVIQTPMGPASVSPGRQPKYSNLCWALRQGLVRQDQFNLDEFGKLYRHCAELGYTGGCPAPADVVKWMVQQTEAGTLPHISVSDAELAGIPHAPEWSGKSCAEINVMAGLTGYSAPWSDALVSDFQSVSSGPDTGVGQWIQDHPWLSLAIAVGGAVAISRRRK